MKLSFYRLPTIFSNYEDYYAKPVTICEGIHLGHLNETASRVEVIDCDTAPKAKVYITIGLMAFGFLLLYLMVAFSLKRCRARLLLRKDFLGTMMNSYDINHTIIR